MFGQFGFIGCRPREMAVKCSDTTDLVYLENGDFVSILKNFQDDYEKYSMMKDEVNFKDKKLNTKCSSCGSFDHTLLECGLVLPQFNRFRIAIRHIYPVLQKRQAVIREGVKFHTFLLNQLVRDDLKHIRKKLAMQFEQPGEMEELSEDSDNNNNNNPGGTGMPGGKLARMDDRDYFLNQKMQFQFIDGEIVNIESDATSNNLTEQSMSDNLQNKSRSRRFSDASSFNESIPEITVRQQQYQRQVSIMKNPNNLYMRQNTATAKQSLFRLESLANAGEAVSKEASPVLSKGSPHEKNKIKSVFGGLGNNNNATKSQLRKKVSIVVGGKVMDDDDDDDEGENDEYREIENGSKPDIDGVVEENEKYMSRKSSGSKVKIESEKSIVNKSERSIASNRNIRNEQNPSSLKEIQPDETEEQQLKSRQQQQQQFQRHWIHTAVSQIPEGKSEGSSSSIGGTSMNQNQVDTASELRIDLLKLVGYNSDSAVSSMRMSNKNSHTFESSQILAKASTFNKSNSSSNHLEVSTSQFQPKKQLTADSGGLNNDQRMKFTKSLSNQGISQQKLRSSSVNSQKSSENRIEDIGKIAGMEGSDSDLSEILSEMNEQESQQQLSRKNSKLQRSNFEKKNSSQITPKATAEEAKDSQEDQLPNTDGALDKQAITSLAKITEESQKKIQDLCAKETISDKKIETDEKYQKQLSNAMLNQAKIARQATTLKQSLSSTGQVLLVRNHSEEQPSEITKDFTIPIQNLMVNISTNQDCQTNQSETPRAHSPASSNTQTRQQSSSPVSALSQDEVIHKESQGNGMGFGLHRFQHLTQNNNEGVTSKFHKQVSIVSDNNNINEERASPETPSPLQFGRLTRQLSSIKNGLSQGSDIRKLLFARASSKILGISGEDLPPLQALHVLNSLSSPGQELQHGQQISNNNVFQAGQTSQMGLVSGSSSSGQPESSNPSTPSRQSLNSNASGMMKKQPLGFTPTSVDSFSQSLNKQQQFHQFGQKGVVGGAGSGYPSSSSSTPRVGLFQRNSENNSGSSRKQATVILPQFPPNSNSNSGSMPTSQHKINNNSLTEVELEDQYENGDLFMYDFDLMKEFKIYYPHLNYKKVLNAVSRQRKPLGQNKSLHNNAFIQKLMNKKKQIPRRLPSLMKQFDLKELKEEEEE